MKTALLVLPVIFFSGCAENYKPAATPRRQVTVEYRATKSGPVADRHRVCEEVGSESDNWTCEIYECPGPPTDIHQDISCTLVDKYGCDTGDEGCPES